MVRITQKEKLARVEAAARDWQITAALWRELYFEAVTESVDAKAQVIGHRAEADTLSLEMEKS